MRRYGSCPGFVRLMEKSLVNPSLYLILYTPFRNTGADNPTYLKEKGDTVYVWLAFAGLSVGVANILNGLYNMSYGINKLN